MSQSEFHTDHTLYDHESTPTKSDVTNPSFRMIIFKNLEYRGKDFSTGETSKQSDTNCNMESK